MITKIKIKKGDTVVVVAGKDKNKTGEVLKVYPKELKILVQGVNIVKRHQKPSATSAGGIVEKEMAIHISNVAYLDPNKSKPTKIGYKLDGGKKFRYAKLSGTILDA